MGPTTTLEIDMPFKHIAVVGRVEQETLIHADSVSYLFGTPSPWAVILVKFADDPAASPDKTIYENLFTTAGSAKTHNMPDFFETISHGHLNLRGSKVFGWYTLAAVRADYVGNTYPQPAGKLNRDGLANAARAVASANGVDLTLFSGTVVSAYGSTDLCGWVGGMTALCDQNSLQPSLLGQEMGHGYGLDHARLDGSTADYQDPWDVMSTATFQWTMEEPDPDYTYIGPGLNAQCMRSRGWLDESRVWKGSAVFDTVVTLRPLHHVELPGLLAAEIGPFLVELRVPEAWDLHIGEACVLVHRFEDNHSYLMPANDGSQSLTVGDVFEAGTVAFPYADYLRVEVIAIDASNHTASIRLVKRIRIPYPQVVGTVYGGVEVDGGGFIVINGHRHPIPPRGPVEEIAGHVARLTQSEITGDVALALASRRAILTSIIRSAGRMLDEADLISSPPPRAGLQVQKGEARNTR